MSIAVTNCCTAFVLYDFLDIDTLQRLEQQALEMKVPFLFLVSLRLRTLTDDMLSICKAGRRPTSR